MRQSKHILWACVACFSCLIVGDLQAQQSASRVSVQPGQSNVNVNARGSAGSPRQVTQSVVHRQDQPVAEPSYIAVVGAVKNPAVFETTEKSVALGTLIERAGGQSAESIGTVRIMERALTRYQINVISNRDRPVTNGQVVFVVPRGGRTSHIVDPRQPAPDRMVLISGLARGPLLFNIGNQSRTFGDLLVMLGQSPDLLAAEQVVATQPQGSWMSLESLLVHNTIIDFKPESVNRDGIQRAVERGFRYEMPVKLDAVTAVPQVSPTPMSIQPSVPVRQAPVPVPRPAPPRVAPPPPVTFDEPQAETGTGIEPAGSSIPFDAPMPLPSQLDKGVEPEDVTPSTKSDGRAPLMLPRNWPNSETDSAESEVESPARVIERTSADMSDEAHHIVTVSAEVAETKPRQPSPPAATEPTPVDDLESAGAQVSVPAAQIGPSWLALIVTIGVALLSVVVSRVIAGRETEEVEPEPLAETSLTELELEVQPPTPEPSVSTTDQENDQRFLQRLILNKVPLVEEEAVLPPVDRLHGIAIGGRRLMVHEPHAGVSGPHFKVRKSGDTRALELRLRRVMREEGAGSAPTSRTLVTTGGREASVSKVGPLERALRNVERGGAQ